MVRTLEGGKRISGGKAPRKFVGSATASPSSSSKASSSGYKGLNPLVHRETPSWQKPITGFFNKNDNCDALEKDSELIDSNNKKELTKITENLAESSKINEVNSESDNEEIVNKKAKRVICSDDENEENQAPIESQSDENR